MPRPHTAKSRLAARRAGGPKAARVFVHRGPANDVCYVGYVAVDEHAFADCITRVQASASTVTEAEPADAAARGVTRMVYTHAPWGTRVEIAVG